MEGTKALSTALQNTNCKLIGLEWVSVLFEVKIYDKLHLKNATNNIMMNLNINQLLSEFTYSNKYMNSLYENQIGAEGAKALSTALQNPNCKLTSLKWVSVLFEVKIYDKLNLKDATNNRMMNLNINQLPLNLFKWIHK